ncbi:MAG TPA: DsbA family protein [Kofleriaceae bacterium]|nr:DsbA family protein [Kofleriaceae bacterium]
MDDRDVTADAELAAIADACGVPLTRIEDPAIKQTLRDYGDDAVRRGAFGAPAFFAGDDLYWGNDRLHQLEAALSR